MSRFKQATRSRARLRMAIDGPSGSGKTYTALRFATAFGESPRIAVIDTERGSASKYTGEKPDGNEWNFDALELLSFSPTEYAAAIDEAGKEGYDVLVIDSLSHAWEGKDGALELVDKSASHNKFSAWKDVTPMHRRMVDAILSSPCHVICTMRSKTEYILETNEKGRQVPTKVGLQPIQRAGMEYEFDVYASMNQSHTLTISKTRCSALDGLVVVKPSATFMVPLIEWLNTGQTTANISAISVQRITNDQLGLLVQATLAHNLQGEALERELLKRYQVRQLIDLTSQQAEELIKKWGIKPKVEVSTNGHVQTEQPPSVAMTTTEQLEAMRAALIDLRKVGRSLTKEQWAGILSKRGVTEEPNLTYDQAADIINNLKKRYQEGAASHVHADTATN